MLNNYKQLTGRYLKANKKRTILTIIGIIMSVALISSIGLFIRGIQLAEIESAKKDKGAFHLTYNNIDSSLITKIENNPKVSRSGLIKESYVTEINNYEVSNITATNKGLELLPYVIKEGRLPVASNEIAMEGWALRKIDKNIKLGDTVTIAEKEYKLTGILEDSVKSQMENSMILLSINEDLKEDLTDLILLVEISPKTNIQTAYEELIKLHNKNDIGQNSYLLTLQGAYGANEDMGSLYLLVFIIIGIVVIATIAVIYNAFQISVVERIKQFGLLRAIGSTPKQIKSIVFREATIIAVIGIPLGLIFGVLAIYSIGFAFDIIGGADLRIMKPSADYGVLAISTIVGIAAIYVSAWIPARYASKISPLVAISSRNAINKEKIKRRRSFTVNRLMGFEGSLAYKNIKRNKKRYRITVFSIVISVVLFIVFKSFMDMSLTVTTGVNESSNMHFKVYKSYNSEDYESGKGIDEKIIDEIRGIKEISKSYKTYSSEHFEIAIDRNQEIKEIQESYPDYYEEITYNGEEKAKVFGGVQVFEKDAFEAAKNYLSSGDIDINKMNEELGVIIIAKSYVFFPGDNKTYFGPAADLKVGDELPLQLMDISSENPQEFGKGNMQKVKIMGILSEDPFSFNGNESGIKIVATEEVAEKITGKDLQPTGLEITLKDAKDELVALEKIESVTDKDVSLEVYNYIDMNRSNKAQTLMIQILIYGFVIVIALISSVNIVNTLTTNILLRQREFASLKSIGLTQKSLRKMIVMEGLFYGIIGAIYGSIIATGIVYLMYGQINSMRGLEWSIPWQAIGIAAASSLIIGYLSVLSPLNRVKKFNLIDTIKDEH